MRRRNTPPAGQTFDYQAVPRPSDHLLHSTLLASVKVQLSQLLEETVDSFARLDIAEGRRRSSAIRESLVRLELGALEATALLHEEARRGRR